MSSPSICNVNEAALIAQTLTDPRFTKLAQEHFPTLRLHEEYDAARESTK